VNADPSAWIRTLCRSLSKRHGHVAQEAGARLRAHLHQRDEADLQFPAFPFARFIARSGARDEFAAQIAADIGGGEFTIGDLAARFVEIGIDQSGNAELLALADKPLVSIMGAVKLGELCASDADPAEPVSDLMSMTSPGQTAVRSASPGSQRFCETRRR